MIGLRISFETEMPLSLIPSSPPTRLRVTSGRSVQGSTWLCIWLTLPKALRILPTFTSKPAGSDVNVRKPSSMPAPSGPNVRKKSAFAYGSTTAWNDVSASFICSAGDGSTVFLPAAPRKLPITAISGLNTFDAALTLPYTGSWPGASGAPGVTGPAGAVGACATGASGVGGACAAASVGDCGASGPGVSGAGGVTAAAGSDGAAGGFAAALASAACWGDRGAGGQGCSAGDG